MKLSQIPKTLKLGPYKKRHPNGNGLKTLGAGKIRRSSTSKKKTTTIGSKRQRGGGRRRTGRGIGMALAALAAPIVNAIIGSL